MRKGRCVERRSAAGPISQGSVVIVGYGEAAGELSNIAPGDAVEIRQSLNRGDADWNKCDSIIQAGPFILSNGVIQSDNENLSRASPRDDTQDGYRITDRGKCILCVGEAETDSQIVSTLYEAAKLLHKPSDSR